MGDSLSHLDDLLLLFIYKKMDRWIMQFKTFYWPRHYGI